MAALGLALHTTSAELGLALGASPADWRCQAWHLDRELSIRLHGQLAEFLAPQAWKDLAFLAVAIGPGSFTSTRVGVVTARTLAQQLGIPLFGISALAAAAWQAWQAGENRAIAARMVARRQQLFGAIYEPTADGLQVRAPVATFTPETWLAALQALTIPHVELELPETLGADALGILALGTAAWQAGQHPHWSEVVPFYGQHPIEEKPLPQPPVQAVGDAP